MDLTPYVDSLRRELAAAAEAIGPEAQGLTERLGFAVDAAARLALMEAVSQAASEITAELPTGGVDVRLEGRQLAFAVDAGAPPAPPAPPAPSAPPADEVEDGGVVRITLRLPEAVKNRAEDLAAQAGTSLNTWLVGAVRAATRDQVVSVDLDLSSLPFGGSDRGPSGPRNRRMTGWV